MKLKFDQPSIRVVLVIIAIAMTNLIFAQRSISGTVTDAETNEPLIGASVLVSGTSTGTVTDFDGNYSLSVPDNASSLEFSYTGYANQTVDISGSNVIDAQLGAGTVLDEVVVIGYGSVKRSDVTGSVASLSEKNFNKGVVLAPDQLIQGKIPGVQMTNNSGQPGGSTTLRIRGNSSIRAGNDPLYVIDGVPLDGRSARPSFNATGLGNTPPSNPLNFIGTIDIASIDILKDASAAAIYGSRAANGVVLITTKKGKPGTPTVEFNAAVGTSSILKEYDILNASEYRAALSQYGLTSGDDGSDVNAFDEILQNGLTQDYSVAFGGGSDRGTYRVSLGYLDQEGIVKETGIQKLTGNLGGSFTLLNNRKLKVDYGLLVSQLNEDLAPISTDAGFTGNLIGQALQWNPTTPLYNTDGSLNVLKGSTTVNPLAYLEAFSDQVDLTTILSRISPSYEIIDGLTYRLTYSINQSRGERFGQTSSFINIQDVEGRGTAFVGSGKLTTQQLTHTLSYDTDINSNIGLNLLAGYEYLKFNNSSTFTQAQDFKFDVINYYDYIQGSSTPSRLIGASVFPESELQSYFARANFNFSDKFLVTATVRADGSSKFGDNNKYGVFPSVAAAYNLTDLFSNGVDDLKLRVGWGQIGNQEFPAGAARTQYQINNEGGVQRLNAENPNLKWETTTTFNVGLDYSLFDYRLTGTIEFFNKTTEDLLFNSPLAAPGPAITIWKNLSGEVVNQGLELGINGYLVQSETFSWNLGIAASFLTNELRNYTDPTTPIGGLFGQGISGATSQRIADEQPISVFYLREHLGIGEDGQSTFANNEELDYLGDPNPNTLLGISSYMNIGDFDFTFAFNGAFGHQLYNNTANTVIPIGNLLSSRNIDANLLESANQESLSNPIKASSRYMEDGDFLKLTNATLGYNLGNNIAGFKNLRLYVTGQNLLVFTNYTGFDPEVNTVNFSANGVPSLGIEYIPYPTSRTFLFGINASF